MKVVYSVWQAAARQVVWKLLVILLVMAAVELGLFWYLAENPALWEFTAGAGQGPGFGAWLDKAGVFWAFFVSVFCLAGVLIHQGSDYSGGRLRYTLQRLPLGEKAVTGLWAVFHGACFVVLWAAQTVVVLLCWRMYCRSWEVAAPALELFVECYLDGFLHGLFPLGEAVRWVRQLLWLLVMSVGTAYFGFRQRRGKTSVGPMAAVTAGLATFRVNLSYGTEWDYIMSGLFGIMLLYFIWQIGWGDDEES